MKLRKILLILDQSFGAKEFKNFNYQARSLGHYIGRHIEKLRFDTPYAQLAVAVQDKHLPEVEKYFPQSLLIRIPFEVHKYIEIKDSDDSILLNKYFISLLMKGLETFHSIEPQVADACEELINSFVAGGYVDEWIHSTLKISKSVHVILACSMTCKEFVAKLCVIDVASDSRTAEKVVFRCKPDELLYFPKLGKLKIADGRVVLLDRFDKPVGFVDL